MMLRATVVISAFLCGTSSLAQHTVVSPEELAAAMGPSANAAPATKHGTAMAIKARTPGTPAKAPDLNDPAVRRRIADGLLGNGFDVWGNHTLPNRCMVYPASYVTYATAVPGVPSQGSWSDIAYVSNYSQHVDNQSFNIGATITYNVFSLGGSHGDASANKFSSFSSYIDVNKGVVGDTATLSPPPGGPVNQIVPSDLAKRAIAHNSDGSFTSKCGQAYVSKVEFGEKIVGTLDYAVQFNSSTKANSNSVSVGVQGILGGSASGGSSSASLSQISAISYHVHGGPAQDPDPDHWLPAIRSYGSDGKFAQANQVVFVEVTSYATVADPAFANFTDPADLAQGSITTLRTEYAINLQQLTDTLAAQRTPDVFSPPTPDYPERIRVLSKYLDDAGKVYRDCKAAITPALATACAKEAQLVTPPPFYAPLALK